MLGACSSVLTGAKQLQDGAVGEAGRGDAVMNARSLGFAPREYVYLHSAALSVRRPAFRAAIAHVGRDLQRALNGPVTVQRSADAHAALLMSELTSPFDDAQLRTRVSADARAHGAIVTILGRDAKLASSNDLSRPERLSVPVTLLVLLLVFGALVAARTRGAGGDRGRRRFWPARPDQPGVPARRQRQDRGAADRDGGRGRLRAVLCRARTRGTTARPGARGRPATNGAHVGSLGAHRRQRGDDRDGRAVRDRLIGLQWHRGGHDGQAIAMLLHDAALEHNEELVQSVCAAAGLALENERLHAQLRAWSSCRPPARGSSMPPMPSAGASNATCTTVPSSGWYRSRCRSGCWRQSCPPTRARPPRSRAPPATR
jgi:hypothetical protein